MKLSKRTIDILKNFSTLNPHIHIESGNKIRSCSSDRNLLMEATVNENFDNCLTLHKLNVFINTLNQFNEPEIELNKNYVLITSGKSKINIKYANKDFIDIPKENIKLPLVYNMTFRLTKEDIQKLNKFVSILETTELIFEKSGDNFTITAGNVNDNSVNTYTLDINEFEEKNETNFKYVIKNHFVNLLQSDYLVSIHERNLIKFDNQNDLVYYSTVMPQYSEWN